MRKKEFGRQSLHQLVEQVLRTTFDDDLGEYVPGEQGQDLLGRDFVMRKYGPVYPAPPTEPPGFYRPSITGWRIKEGTIREEDGLVISRSRNGREFVIVKGIMVPRRDYDELVSLEEKVAPEKKEEELEELENDTITPVKPFFPYNPSRRLPVRRKPIKPEYKRPKNRKRLHKPGWKSRDVLGNAKSKTTFVNENFPSMDDAIKYFLSQPPVGKYSAMVGGKERKFLVVPANFDRQGNSHSINVKVYTSRGIAEIINYNRDGYSFDNLARERELKQRGLEKYKKRMKRES